STEWYNTNIIAASGDKRKIAANYFIGNRVPIWGAALATSGGNDTIECNFFLNNQIEQDGYGVLNIGSGGNTTIRKNIFDSNNYIGATDAVSVGIISSVATLSFNNNTIKNNISAGGYCLKFVPKLTATSPLLSIDHNNFSNNTANSTLMITGGNTGTTA